MTVFPLLFFTAAVSRLNLYDNRDAPIHRADNISTYRDFRFSRAIQFGERRCLWVYLIGTTFSLDALRKRNKQVENI